MSEYNPIRPRGGNIIYDLPEAEIFLADGFYQPAGPDEVDRRRHAVEPFIMGEQPPAELSLQTYQEWVELDWKVQHGSYDAVGRFMDKLFEEAGVELVDAHQKDSNIGEDVDTRNEFVGELGDSLWCTTALASNGGVDITRATRLYQRTWYLHPEAEGPITFGDLESKLADHSFTGVIDPRFLPESEEQEEFVPDISLYLRWFSVSAANVLDRQYAYNERPDFEALSNFLQEITDVKSPAAKKVVRDLALVLEQAKTEDRKSSEVDIMLFESYVRKVANDYLYPLIGDGITFLEHVARKHDVSLGDAAVENIRKITGRVSSNTVDKSDGERSDELK